MADPAISNLAICAGVGMLDEGQHIASGSRTVCYLEREASAAAILLARMADATLEPAPVFCDDLERFDGRPWRSRVDSISAGFPCQPWSQAGKQQGTDDERWIWPEIARIIGEVGPWFVFLENVPGLLIQRGISHVLGSLADLGFDAEWGSLRASDVGAAHQRERIFILAYAARLDGRELRSRWERILDTGARVAESAQRGCGDVREPSGSGGFADRHDAQLADAAHDHGRPGDDRTQEGIRTHGIVWRGSDGLSGTMADAGGGQFSQPERGTDRRDGAGSAGTDMADAERAGSQGNGPGESQRRRESEPCDTDRGIFAPGPADPVWAAILDRAPYLAPAVESGFRCLADGLAVVVDESRADQLRAIGNGVVPLQAAVAFVVLARRINAAQ